MSGKTLRVKREKFTSPNAKESNMLVFLALGNAKGLFFALGDAKVPSANDFAFWWNIGLRLAVASGICLRRHIMSRLRARAVSDPQHVTSAFMVINMLNGGSADDQ